VAERLSGFCEAILNVDDLCKSSLRCCVAKNAFGTNPPDVLVIPNGKSPPPPVKRRTTAAPRRTTTRKPSIKSPQKGGGDCRGTCVTGFFALLCETVDKSVNCPGQLTQCIVQIPHIVPVISYG
jgi:kallikrein